MTAEFKQKLDNGATLDDILPRGVRGRPRGRRSARLGMRHYDVQMIGGMVLHKGRIAEMRTGEGKTLVATLPTLPERARGQGRPRRHRQRLPRQARRRVDGPHPRLPRPAPRASIVHGLDDFERQRNYNCDITYGQNNEFGFDYLRDNMKTSPDRMVQRGLNYAIVDEVDSILIDEARTPLIISGSAEASGDSYVKVDRMIPRLKREVDYTVDEKAHSAMLTDDGVETMEKLLGVDNLYEASEHPARPPRQPGAARAHAVQAQRQLPRRGRQGRHRRRAHRPQDAGPPLVATVCTRRSRPRKASTVEEENQTLATVTFQNYFRMYKKLSGMTGTADTEAPEFHQIYKLDVTVIPTNKPIDAQGPRRTSSTRTRPASSARSSSDIEDCYKRGQPVLVGTVSVEKSEVVANILKAKGLPFNVLNAKQHQREASIVAQAGRKGAITIATNMAGRGTDILLGGNPEAMAKDALAEEKAKLAEDAERRAAGRGRRRRAATRAVPRLERARRSTRRSASRS